MVRVKICGITSAKDALAVQAAGADAIGFIFAKSPRRVSALKVRAITKNLGSRVMKVGVFVNEDPAVLLRMAKACELDAVQLHGEEPAKLVRALRAKGLVVIKALRVRTVKDLALARRHEPDAFLLDTAVAGVHGGTGRCFDWKLLKKFKTEIPVIVSGGLNALNVKELLDKYTPYGVDVSSGVEKSPGVKDVKKVRQFVRHAKLSAE